MRGVKAVVKTDKPGVYKTGGVGGSKTTYWKVGDVKEIALKIAQDRVTKFNALESKVAEENRKRREQAERKAMVPDMFASAGFEEMPKAPDNAKEAGDLLESLLKRQRAN